MISDVPRRLLLEETKLFDTGLYTVYGDPNEYKIVVP